MLRGRPEAWPAAEMLQDWEPTLIPPVDAKRKGQHRLLRLSREPSWGLGTAAPSPPASAGTGQTPVCSPPTLHGTALLPTTAELGPPHTAGWAVDPSPGHVPEPLPVSLGHVLWRALIWWSHDVVEMAWPVLKLDIGNKRAEQPTRDKSKREHLLQSQQTAANSAEAQLRTHPSAHSNLLPRKRGEGLAEGPLFLFQGWGALRSVGRERASADPLDHVNSSFSLPPARTPGQCPLPPMQPPRQTQAPGVSQQPPLPPGFCVTHPLQGKINTSAHIRRRTERSVSWERGRGGCFSHASSRQLALGSLPLGWLWEMALVSLPAAQSCSYTASGK